jgi:hypothetical protein
MFTARSTAALAAAVVLTATPAVLLEPRTAVAADVFTVWMSTTGDDSAAGTSRDQPVASLAGAQRILCPDGDPCTGLGRSVEIRIEPGVYHPHTFSWFYFDDVYPTRFMPADYQLGDTISDVADAGGRPVFDGQGEFGWGILFTPRRLSATGRANVQFFYLEWRNYMRGGLWFGGGPGRTGGNLVKGCYFHRIGNNWNPANPMGLGGMWLGRGSDRNTIRSNHFVDILNTLADRGHEHGLYLVNSRENLITGNRFENIGGDPLRFRNSSSLNTASRNTFRRAGGMGYAGDWHAATEYRSYGNLLSGNMFLGLYPRGLTGRAAGYCYDIRARCPDNRITVRS